MRNTFVPYQRDHNVSNKAAKLFENKNKRNAHSYTRSYIKSVITYNKPSTLDTVSNGSTCVPVQRGLSRGTPSNIGKKDLDHLFQTQ